MLGRKRFKRPKEDENILRLPSHITLEILSRLPLKTINYCKRVCKRFDFDELYIYRMGRARGKRFKPPKEEENILKVLPTEISLDILSRLPAKTVINCACVCKAWRTLLLDPSFPQIHLANAKSSVSLMLTSRKYYWLIDDFRKRKMSKFSHSASNVVGSCNGLLCLLSNVGPNMCHNVWNPVKNECITLPMPNIQIRNHHVGPIPSYHYTRIYSGFGYCPRTNVYKVIITIERALPSMKPMCEVCTVGTNAWRTIEDDVPVPYCTSGIANQNYSIPCSVLKIPLNGAVHWFCRSETGYRSFSLWICAFRIEDEKWDRILLPLSLFQFLDDPWRGPIELGVLENCLAIFDQTAEKSVLNIWMMKDYGVGESWTKCWRIQSKIPSELPLRSLEPLKLTNDGDLLMFDNINKTLVCFNPGQRLITRKQRICGTAEWYIKGIAYVPSFISPTEIIKQGSGEEKLKL